MPTYIVNEEIVVRGRSGNVPARFTLFAETPMEGLNKLQGHLLTLKIWTRIVKGPADSVKLHHSEGIHDSAADRYYTLSVAEEIT